MHLKGEQMMTDTWWRVPVINRRAWTWEDAHRKRRLGEWWQHAVIYQIFPWTFQDSDGNGIGDLEGIIDRFQYIRSLGVEAIWLTPIYPSKHEDAGYAVTYFDDIDPIFGDLDIFRRLLTVAHDFGLKVIIDQVWNHTADTHPWFEQSASSRDNPKADWYVWADAKNGGPPNNWLSAFTGNSAWHWHETRGQYYLGNFMPSQPQLNWYNDAVIDAVLTKARFWLEMGVDGFRIDAVNFFTHDATLQDNPLRTERDGLPDGIAPDNPMARQLFTNSFSREETLGKLHKIRALMDRYPHTVTLGEVTLCEDSIDLAGQYTHGDDRLHLAYNSALLQDEPLSAAMMANVMARVQKHFPTGGQCWMVGNHDYRRLRNRWSGHDSNGNPYGLPFFRMVAAMLVALPGALILYQGDELGLPEARIPEDIAEEQLQDPFGKALYPKLPGRDGSRTPVPWHHDRKNMGFSKAEAPWLPIPESHRDLAVDLQNRDPESLLNTWRCLLQWRVAQPALISGDFAALGVHDAVFGFCRQYAEQTLYCLFNISDTAQTYDIPTPETNQHLHTLLFNQEGHCMNETGTVTLNPYAAVFISYTKEQL
jgi:alpha-glucosidase